MEEKIEILSVSLLDQHRPVVQALRRLASSLGIEFGWHYLLDLSWMISQLGAVQSKQIMDAGAGRGVMQWYLAQWGANVLSVDRESRAGLPLRFRLRFNVTGLREGDLLPLRLAIRSHSGKAVRLLYRLSGEAAEVSHRWVPGRVRQALLRKRGQVVIYNQDLENLADIPEDSIDAVVAVSSLEHNAPDDLTRVVSELMRVLKPGGVLLATLGAAADQDWFHEPSKGWCYSESSLRRLFDLPPGVPSNYADYDRLFSDLKNCRELSENLASFYAKSGENGMPWGIWDPLYQPVGVLKIKRDG